nr:DMT family transporter [Desulfoscipio geothermicus]
MPGSAVLNGCFFPLNYALSHLPASQAAVFMNLTLVVSVLAGVIFFDEYLGNWQFLGGAFILLGVWGTSYLAEKRGKIRNPAQNRAI